MSEPKYLQHYTGKAREAMITEAFPLIQEGLKNQEISSKDLRRVHSLTKKLHHNLIMRAVEKVGFKNNSKLHDWLYNMIFSGFYFSHILVNLKEVENWLEKKGIKSYEKDMLKDMTPVTVEALKAARDVYLDFIPLIDDLKKLNEYKVNSAKYKYKAPKSSHKSVAKVAQVLKKMMKDVYEEQVTQMTDYWMNVSKRFIKNRKLGESPYAYCKRHDFFYYRELEILTEPTEKYAVKPDYKLKSSVYEVAKELATKEVQEMQERFVGKNLQKLTSIIERYGKFVDCTTISVRVKGGRFTGEFLLTFSDADFRVDNQMVLSHSVNGKPFWRFPTTFHDIKIKNTFHKMKSEEWMNNHFNSKELSTA